MRAGCQTSKGRAVGNPTFGNHVPDPPAADGHGHCKEHQIRGRQKSNLNNVVQQKEM